MNDSQIVMLKLHGDPSGSAGAGGFDAYYFSRTGNFHASFHYGKNEVDGEIGAEFGSDFGIEKGSRGADVANQCRLVLQAQSWAVNFRRHGQSNAQAGAALVERAAHYVDSHLTLLQHGNLLWNCMARCTRIAAVMPQVSC